MPFWRKNTEIGKLYLYNNSQIIDLGLRLKSVAQVFVCLYKF